MAVYAVTYDLKTPGQDYSAVFDYLKQFAYCKHMESFWLIDTNKTPTEVADALIEVVDSNDVIFVVRIHQDWAASDNYGCIDWLNSSKRNW